MDKYDEYYEEQAQDESKIEKWELILQNWNKILQKQNYLSNCFPFFPLIKSQTS